MTVAELIAELSKFPMDAEVGYEDCNVWIPIEEVYMSSFRPQVSMGPRDQDDETCEDCGAVGFTKLPDGCKFCSARAHEDLDAED